MTYPIVIAVTPNNGPPGTAVTLSGYNFTGTTSVTFGGTSAGFTVIDDNTITATVPVGPGTGTRTVIVVNASGSSNATSPAVDSSGNGNDGTYNGFLTADPPEWVDGLVPVDAALLNFQPSIPQTTQVSVPPSVIDWSTPWSIAMWFAGEDVAFAGLLQTIFFGAGGGGTRQAGLDVTLELGSSGQMTISDDSGFSTGLSNTTSLPTDGAAHFVGISFDGTNAVYTFDGADIGEATPYVPSGSTPPFALARLGGNAGAAPPILDEYAVFRSALSASDFASLYAARSTLAGYTAAVLGFSPTGYWHLNDGGQNGHFTYPAGGGWHVGSLGVG